MEKLLRFTSKDFQSITFEKWLTSKPKDLQSVATHWYQQMQTCGPDVMVIFHDDYPTACVENVPFAYVNVYTKHINIGFFYGASFFDEHQLLQGTGKRMRHIKIHPNELSNNKAINSFLKTAYLDIKKRIMSD
jgi:Domain of unknown function (DU1801)